MLLRPPFLWKPWTLACVGIAMVAAGGFSEPARGVVRLVPEDYPTIQAAIDASAVGDTVLIGPGTYRGEGNRNLEFHGRDIVVKSRAGAEQTIIDCQQAGRGFYLYEQETRAARIEGLTIINGYAPAGSPGSPTGGGIYCWFASPTIIGCRILQCRSNLGGGFGCTVFEGVIDGCTFSENYGDSRGGGIALGLGESEVRNCVITGNGSPTGAGVASGGPGPNRLIGCTITANLCGMDGGGVFTSSPLYLERCIVWDNCSIVSEETHEIACRIADVRCSDIDVTGVSALGQISYDEDCISVDPTFCSPYPCGWHTYGDWTLDGASMCLPQTSPCGELIGALGMGCGSGAEVAACCLANGSCLELGADQCANQSGTYMGAGSTCESNPCQPTPTKQTTWGQLKALYR